MGISANPPSLTWDEAAWGYNAYSIGIDGKDEFGRFLPITYLESFGDFKPPLYAYLSVIPVKIFGLNEFSTRFASAFFGTLTVLLTYFLAVELLLNRGSASTKASEDKPVFIAILSACLLAISPWHILLSRAAFEANVASFFIVLGVYLFFISLKKPWWLVLSVVSFVLSMYTFNTARIVSPLLLLILVIPNLKYFAKNSIVQFTTAVALGALMFAPLFIFLLTPQAKLRFAEVNIFTDSEVVERANQKIENDGNAIWSNVINNRRVGYSIEYLKHYFDNLSPGFLFVKGDGNPKFSIQDVGQMYIWEIPFFLAGILFLFRKKGGYWWFIPAWLLIGIIPAGSARETPHALRIEAVLPTFQILTAMGVYYIYLIVLSMKYKVLSIEVGRILAAACVIFALFNVSYFVHTYFVHYPREYSGEWQYGYRDAIAFTKENKSKFKNIYITDELGRPYIYALFYEKTDPVEFREKSEVYREALGFVHVRQLNKYKFVNSVKDNINQEENNLYIDKPWDIPENARVLATFKELDGNTTLVAYTI